LFYFGSSTCPYCKSKALDSTLTTFSDSLENYSRTKNINFNKIGVSQDANVANGIEHLMSLELVFNEIATGNRWRNVITEKYTNNEFQAILGTPQLLIIKRVYTDSLGIQMINSIDSEVQIARFVGLTNIINIDYTRLFSLIDSHY
jgi:hypothetical protein